MALNFPNPSRSYDPSRHCVCFWGYDNSREIAFEVDRAVLSTLSPELRPDEPAVLDAFDRHRDHILELARGLYSRSRQNRYQIS
ncbi:DUF1488 domain-containing protein [Cupriavidus basilensis]|uniref:DUF1488 domain-containing protein n=1 Tax=Cupriavidus TaxID=106589 RepID=UPI0004458DBE|nr:MULTISPECIES: DUF1488 domain-containing protein [Cupriavidus]KDP84820.1 hypothetical protein CF70_017340 [Cupriavidus sp. SK-3]MDF3888961.1 DUF1488 domain-containing protein [Cupriavidus basilensis]